MNNVDKYRREIDKSSKVSQTANAKKPKTTKIASLSKDPGNTIKSDGHVNGASFFASLLQATIFFDYFEHVANKTYKGDRTDVKILKLKTLHPVFHRWCIRADYCARFLGFIALFVFAAMSAYKLIWR